MKKRNLEKIPVDSKGRPKQHYLEKIKDRDNWTCQYCGYSVYNLQESRGMVVDHIVPFIYSQDNSMENLITACSICNKYLHSSIFESFRDKKHYIRNILKQKHYQIYK